MNNSIYQHISKRVTALGYSDFSMQAVQAKLNLVDKTRIEAYNELYFLVGSVNGSVKIISDTHASIVDDTYSQSGINGLLEFSGLIEIDVLNKLEPDSLNFIKVVPK
jgi:hypothetical protein